MKNDDPSVVAALVGGVVALIAFALCAIRAPGMSFGCLILGGVLGWAACRFFGGKVDSDG